jgi:hypothetical protein
VKKGEREFCHSEGVLCVDLHNAFHQDEEAGEHKDGNLKKNFKQNVSDVDCAYQDVVYYPFTKKSMKWTRKLVMLMGVMGLFEFCYL